jgi:c-di-GMP-binding flagellar brake protein YcgR
VSAKPAQPLFERLVHLVSGAERRRAVRHSCKQLLPVPVLARPSFQKSTAYLKDISATGLGLITQGRMDRGCALLVQLRGDQPGATVTHLARVVHSRRQGSKHWFVGCQLACRLTADEIQRVLDAAG